MAFKTSWRVFAERKNRCFDIPVWLPTPRMKERSWYVAENGKQPYLHDRFPQATRPLLAKNIAVFRFDDLIASPYGSFPPPYLTPEVRLETPRIQTEIKRKPFFRICCMSLSFSLTLWSAVFRLSYVMLHELAFFLLACVLPLTTQSKKGRTKKRRRAFWLLLRQASHCRSYLGMEACASDPLVISISGWNVIIENPGTDKVS